MKILVAGLSKSGTTWFFFRLRKSMPKKTQVFFEKTRGLTAALKKPGASVLAKLLVGPIPPEKFEDFSEADRKIFIYRDPRDQIVSKLLYEIAYHVLPAKSSEAFESFLELLRLKEKDPAGIPLSVLFCKAWNCELEAYLVWVRESFRKALLFNALHPEYFRLRYRDLVDGKIEALEQYLGFKLLEETVTEDFYRVVRTQSYGNWRSWWTPDDIAILKPVLLEPMSAWGYDQEDWELDPKPGIQSREASGYVARVYAQWHKLEEKKDIFKWCRLAAI